MGLFDPKKISTQDHLDIEDIREDMVVLKNGKVAVIVETTSINFDLLDAKEQDARIYSFASFLNSIRFPIQIVIKTQRTDIAKYLKLLDSYKNRVGSETIAKQVNIYQDFISNLTENTLILDKRFFTVIPSTKITTVSSSWVKEMFGKPQRMVNIKDVVAKAKEELTPKTGHIIDQYGNMGIAARQLQNDELIKLYYSVYEPDKSGFEVLNLRETDINEGLVSGG